jgi:hypothetical protein
MRIQGLFTAAKLLALLAVVIAGVVHIAGGQNTLVYNNHGNKKCIQNFNRKQCGGKKRYNVKGDWRKCLAEQLHDLDASPDIVRGIKLTEE